MKNAPEAVDPRKLVGRLQKLEDSGRANTWPLRASHTNLSPRVLREIAKELRVGVGTVRRASER